MDFRLDPTTGDYDGTRIADLANAIYLRITTPLGSYWADLTLGSELYKLARSKDLPRVRQLAIQYTKAALQPLIDSKRALSIEVDAIMAHDGRLQLLGTVSDRSGQSTPFQHFVRVG